MTEVISVRFRHVGKAYYFGPGSLEIGTGSYVIVETARGVEIGEVRQGNHEVEDDLITPPLKEVIRIATPEDLAHEADNREREKEAFRVCKQKINEKGLDMKLIYCEYTFDNSKILFYFTADGRVDFRDLVKELAGVFRTRIELRQVGVRDETKLLGGLGSCGRPLCCATWLTDFAPVSIKMAKEQNLSLNPVKISGVCGRLMCCLGNEEEVYEELNKKLPGTGDLVDLADGGRGEVQSVGILKQLVKVIVELPGDEKEVREYPAEDVTVRVRRRDKNRMREQAESREREAKKEREKEGRAGRSEAGAENLPEETEKSAGGEEKKERSGRRDRRDRSNRDESRSENRGERKDRREDENRGERKNHREGENRGEGKDRDEGGNRGEGKDRRDRRNRGNREGGEKKERPAAAGDIAGEKKENSGKPANGGTRENGEQREHRRNRHHDRRREGAPAEGRGAEDGGNRQAPAEQ